MRLAPNAPEALSAREATSTGRAGLAISVATSDMDVSGTAAPLEPLKNAILIAGPTASGKSALAIELARKVNGVVINADSMQVYGILRLLTARPSDDDLLAAPHLLYGQVDPRDQYSTGNWARDVEAILGSG